MERQYGLVYRDAAKGWIMLGRFNDEHTITEFVQILDAKYNDFPETLFSVVDIEENALGRLRLMDISSFELSPSDDAPPAKAADVVGNLFGAEDEGREVFSSMYDNIIAESKGCWH